jgi:hypothetical protein
VDGGSVSGSTTSTLMISPLALSDIAAYDCVVSNACGVQRSDAAVVVVTPCRADLNDDGAVNGLDTQAFVDDLLSSQTCP